MSLKEEFKSFIAKGNVVDLAVAVIMGGAFGKVVSSLVADIIMPPIGYLVGGISFTDLKFTLPALLGKSPATINYGNFLQSAFDFLIVAIAVFSFVKAVSVIKLRRDPSAGPSEEIKLLTEIRDALRKSS